MMCFFFSSRRRHSMYWRDLSSDVFSSDLPGSAESEDAVAVNTRRVKSVEDSIRDTDEPEHRLKKNLSGLDLTVFGVGVIIGTGIFVLDRKSTRLNSSHANISYAVFCLTKNTSSVVSQPS